jgi:phage gpG-like protein
MSIVRRIIQFPFGARIVVYTDADDLLRYGDEQKKRYGKMPEFLKQVANILRADAREQFKIGGDPAWKSLSPVTIARKAALGYPMLTKTGRIPWRLKQNGNFGAANKLIMSGRLRDAWGRKDSPDHYENIDIDKGTVEMGPKLENIIYARIQQKGGMAGKNHKVYIPGRPVRTSRRAIEKIAALSNTMFFSNQPASGGTPSEEQ